MNRPQRIRKATEKAEAIPETEQLVSQICDPKAAKKRKKIAVQPMAAEPEAACQLHKENLPDYHPPLHLRKFSSRPALHPQSELEAFRLYITHDIIEILVQNTNSYAENDRQQLPSYPFATPWFPTTTTEM
jgi:hypothetical protein